MHYDLIVNLDFRSHCFVGIELNLGSVEVGYER